LLLNLVVFPVMRVVFALLGMMKVVKRLKLKLVQTYAG
jgi:hypothetical protein